jgi:hemolysin activation/secretion protein
MRWAGRILALPLALASTVVFAEEPQMLYAGPADNLGVQVEVYTDSIAAQESEVIQLLLAVAQNDAAALLLDDQRYSMESLAPLENYLDLLFPELDIGAPISLRAVQVNETQLDQLFNLYFDLSAQELAQEEPRQDYLDSIGFSLSHFLARRFTELAVGQGACLSASARGEPASMPTTVTLDIVENPESCSLEATAQTIWVNKLALTADDSAAENKLESGQFVELLEQQRVRAMGLGETSPAGIETIELIRLTQTLGNLYNNSVGGTALTADMLLPLMLQLDRIRRPLGINFDELKSIADEMQVWYRQQGYFLTNVYVPQQNFESATGEINLRVSFGILGDVVVRNEEDLHYAPDVILDPFRAYLGNEVTRDIYSAYFNVNDLPGLTITSGLFEPGDKAGETRLVLDVRERKFEFNLVADNFGSEFTGEQRFLALADWLSPLGRGDKLSAGALQSTSPSNSTYGFVNYRLPVFNIAHELTASWNTHSYESIDSRTGTQVLILGDVTEAYLGYDYKWKRSKEINLLSGFQVYAKESDVEVTLPQDGDVQVSKQETEVEGFLIHANGDFLQRSLRAVTAWQAAALYGERKGLYDPRLGDDYTLLTFNSELSALLPFGPFTNRSHLSARFVGSYSDDVLPSFEQTPLGGPYGVRAFVTSDFTADSLAFISLQWQIDLARAFLDSENTDHSLRLGAFFEGGYGRANGIGGAPDSTASLGGYGLILNYAWRNKLTLETSISFPAFDDASDDFNGEFSDDSSRLLFTLRYSLF